MRLVSIYRFAVLRHFPLLSVHATSTISAASVLLRGTHEMRAVVFMYY